MVIPFDNVFAWLNTYIKFAHIIDNILHIATFSFENFQVVNIGMLLVIIVLQNASFNIHNHNLWALINTHSLYCIQFQAKPVVYKGPKHTVVKPIYQ